MSDAERQELTEQSGKRDEAEGRACERGYLNALRGDRAYERGYLDALRRVRNHLSGSGAFNCGAYRGFEYPAEMVEAMIQEIDRRV